jgi:hypothetical protein
MSKKTRTNGRPPLPTTALHALDLYLPVVRRTSAKNFGRNFIADEDQSAGSGNAWLVCPDCSHWVEVLRGLVQTHRPAGHRCPGSAQVVDFDLTVGQHAALCAAALQYLRAKNRTHPVRPVLREGQRRGTRRIAARAAQQYTGHKARTETAATLETVWERFARVPFAPAPCQIAAQRADYAEYLAERPAQPARQQARPATDAVQPDAPETDCEVDVQDAAGCDRPARPQLEAGPHTRMTGHVHPEFWFSRTELAFANPFANTAADLIATGRDIAAARAAKAETVGRLAREALGRARATHHRQAAAPTITLRFVEKVALLTGMQDLDERAVRKAHRLAVAELSSTARPDQMDNAQALRIRLTGGRAQCAPGARTP